MNRLSIFRRPTEIEQPADNLAAAERLLDGDRTIRIRPLADGRQRAERAAWVAATADRLRMGTEHFQGVASGVNAREQLAARYGFQRWRIAAGELSDGTGLP